MMCFPWNVIGFRTWRLSCFLVVWLWTSHLMSLIFSCFFCSLEILVPITWWLIYNNQISWSEYAVKLVEHWGKCFCWWQFIFPFSASCHWSELEIWVISISEVFLFFLCGPPHPQMDESMREKAELWIYPSSDVISFNSLEYKSNMSISIW